MGLREAILDNPDPALQLEEIPVPEWGQSVFLRGWTGKERDAYEDEFGDLKEKQATNLRARILVRYLLDAEGHRIFSDEDADRLGDKYAGPLVRLYARVFRKAGGRQEDVEAVRKN